MGEERLNSQTALSPAHYGQSYSSGLEARELENVALLSDGSGRCSGEMGIGESFASLHHHSIQERQVNANRTRPLLLRVTLSWLQHTVSSWSASQGRGDLRRLESCLRCKVTLRCPRTNGKSLSVLLLTCGG